MKTDTKIIIAAIIVSLTFIGGAMAFFGNEKAPPKRQDLGVASMTIDKSSENLGSMKVSDERSAIFTITNTSNQVLRLWNIATSCDCTFASVTIAGTTTGEFNMTMHTTGDLKNWIGEVPPKQQATLTVTYRPSVMPVQGPVTRQVNFSTNDPKNENVQVSISANVL